MGGGGGSISQSIITNTSVRYLNIQSGSLLTIITSNSGSEDFINFRTNGDVTDQPTADYYMGYAIRWGGNIRIVAFHMMGNDIYTKSARWYNDTWNWQSWNKVSFN